MIKEIIHLKNDKITMEISPELGGRVCSMRSIEYGDILYPLQFDDNPEIGVDKPILCGGSYPLSPYSNRIENAVFEWGNKQYKLPVSPICPPHAIHGVAQYSNWQVLEQGEISATIILNHKKNDNWGFDFTLKQTFELQDNKFINTLTFVNTDNVHQPVGLGFHPFFTTKNLQTLHIPATKIWDLDAGIARKTKSIPQHQDFNTPKPFTDKIDDLFQGVSNGCVATYDTHKINIKSNSQYALLFSNDVDNFFCFEPVENVTNSHNMQTNTTIQNGTYNLDYGLTAVAPSDKHSFSMIISVDNI